MSGLLKVTEPGGQSWDRGRCPLVLSASRGQCATPVPKALVLPLGDHMQSGAAPTAYPMASRCSPISS